MVLTEKSSQSYFPQQAIDLICSLIIVSHSVKVFPGKWQLIRNKLQELNSGLVSVHNCDSDDNPLVSDLIPSIIATVNECQDLARRCVSFSYSGKLLMRSDLDVISSRLVHHISILTDIYKAGLLTYHSAIVVARPGSISSRDDMRFYAMDLITRMKIGDVDMKRRALNSLNEVMIQEERYASILTVEISDGLSLIAGFLDSPEHEVQEEAARAASILSSFDSCKKALIKAGIIGPLIRVFDSRNVFGKEWAARSLCNLTYNSDNAWSVLSHGGVTALLRICGDFECNVELIGLCCEVLKNLVNVEEIRKFMVEEGAISTLSSLARLKDESTNIISIEILQIMASRDESIRKQIVEVGTIGIIVRMLGTESSTLKLKEVALRAIEAFCSPSPKCLDGMIHCEFFNHLLLLLQSVAANSVQEAALKVLIRACEYWDEAKKAIGEAGFMALIVKMLNSKSLRVRELSAEALKLIISLSKNRRKFLHDDESVCMVIQSVEEGGYGNYNKFLLDIVMELTGCVSGRRKILSSGYVKNIEKLAEAEVSEAKRIVRKLRENKFKSLLSGIWHH